MSNNFSPDPQPVLDYLSQPVFFVQAEQIIYQNRAAAALTRREDVSLPDLLTPEDLECYRAFRGDGALELALEMDGRSYSTSIHREAAYDVFVSRTAPMFDGLSLDTLSVVAQAVRANLSDVFDTVSVLFPMLEESEDPKIQKETARLNKSFYRMLRMAANLSDTGRLIAGESRAYLERTELTEFIGQIYDRTESLCETVGVELQYQCPSKPFFAAIDRQKIERAVLNLMDNALRYTPRGGKLVLRLENLGHNVLLRLSDNGEGIDPGLMSSLFDRYAHRDQFGDPRWGVGLGLPLVRHIANLHGGTVVINSAPGGGTSVTMSISRTLSPSPKDEVNSPVLNYDYAGGYDHTMVELSDAMPCGVFDTICLN